MNYTYILKCADGTLYTGWTNDIEKRLEAHNSGKGARYTKSRLPVSLFYLEEHLDRKTAMRREVMIKKLTREQKMELAETKKRILLVNACVRPESRTMELAREVLKHLDGVVEEVNIEKEKILPLTNAQMEKRQAACDAGTTDLPMMKYAKQTGKKPIIGVRQSESKTRKAKYSSCLQCNGNFTPIYDFSDLLMDSIYEAYGIEVPKCYTYIARSGCAGCPYGRNCEKELALLPDLQRKAAIEYFVESYDAKGIEYRNIQYVMDL